MSSKAHKNIVIAITGASGSIYAQKLIDKLSVLSNKNNLSISIIISDPGREVIKYELGNNFISTIPHKIYNINDFYAPFASGSSVADAMVIIPCSMGTLGRVATGITDNLISRTADVVLKERKKLILVTREAPLNLIHIRNMETITLAGGIIMPASPSFYSFHKNIDELIENFVNRVLDLLGFYPAAKRW